MHIMQIFNFADVASGVVGAPSRHPSPDCGSVHVHVRPAIPCNTPPAQRRLDAADKVPSASGLGHLRVPDQYHAAYEPFYTPECCR